MADHQHDDLARDLVALGRGADIPAASAGLAVAVVERLPERTGTAPVRLGTSARRRRIAVVVVAVLLGLLATPPVRAAVADWFGFGGVRVERGESQAPTTDVSAPTVPPSVSLTEAVAAVDFPVSVPSELGDPDGVEVSGDRRMVSMSWTTDEEGIFRLDQFDATLDFTVLKVAPEVSYAEVDGTDALWFEEPHEVALLEPDGTQVVHSARLAGHTLIWQWGGVTLRLEGEMDSGRAVEIAESTELVG